MLQYLGTRKSEFRAAGSMGCGVTVGRDQATLAATPTSFKSSGRFALGGTIAKRVENFGMAAREKSRIEVSIFSTPAVYIYSIFSLRCK